MVARTVGLPSVACSAGLLMTTISMERGVTSWSTASAASTTPKTLSKVPVISTVTSRRITGPSAAMPSTGASTLVRIDCSRTTVPSVGRVIAESRWSRSMPSASGRQRRLHSSRNEETLCSIRFRLLRCEMFSLLTASRRCASSCMRRART